MKNRKRAERRRNNARLFKKRYLEEKSSYWVFPDDNMCRLRARKRVDTKVSCSCVMCGNPRRHHGGGHTWGSRTLQEHRADDKLASGVEEFLENA